MNAQQLLDFSTQLAGFAETPQDSCVIYDSGRPITRLLASINAEPGDLILASQMGCDGYLLHHPLAGSARRNFHKVLDRMVELMLMHGVPDSQARQATFDLRRRVRFFDHAGDWDHLTSVAAHLDLSLVNVHLAADELGRLAMVEAVQQVDDSATLEDVADALRTIPELAHPANEIIHIPEGPSGRAGRIAVMHAGGTNGGASVAECLFDHSRGSGGPVRTVVYIHISGEEVKRLEQRAADGLPGSVIITGHLASDAIGMNALMRALRNEARLDIIPHGGLRPFA